MSAIGGAVGVGMALILEEVVLTNNGAPKRVSGMFGTVTKAVSALASSNVAGIPNLAAKKGA